MKKLLALSFLTLSSSLITISNAQSYMLYGMTYEGGTSGNGIIFSLDPTTGKDSVRYNFTGGNDGGLPASNLVFNPGDNMFYGTTFYGGNSGFLGVLFKYNPITNAESYVHLYDGPTGNEPQYGSLTIYKNKIYSMTNSGGALGYGVIYDYDLGTNAYNDLVDFDLTGNLPVTPSTPQGTHLTPYSNGLMYGMAYAGGKDSAGCIFSFNPLTNKDSILINFSVFGGGPAYPQEGTLTLNPHDNKLYGMTALGGKRYLPNYENGVIFRYDPITNKDTVLVQFDTINGFGPTGSLTYDSVNSLFYGMTGYGGTNLDGVLFSYDPSTGKDTVLINFDNATGIFPYGNVTLGPNGMLYGMTNNGGLYSYGTIFRYDPTTGKDTVLVNFDGTNGRQPVSSLTLVDLNTITTRVNNITKANSTTIYPNPFNKSTQIMFNENGKHFIEVDDVTGRKIASAECNEKEYTLQRNELSDGIYFVKVYDGQMNLLSTQKIVVQ